MPFYNSDRRSGTSRVTPAHRSAKEAAPQAAPPTEKGIQLSDTIHLHDLTPAERLVEESAERGFIDEKELVAFSDEHELAEDELAALRTALDERDVIVRAEAAPKSGYAAGLVGRHPRPAAALHGRGRPAQAADRRRRGALWRSASSTATPPRRSG